MSLGYADRLSYREDLGGTLGSPELHDTDADVARKVAILARYVRSVVRSERLSRQLLCALRSSKMAACARAQVQEADRMVAFTGAGISTACGIPDFRGPDGVWTCQRAQRPPPRLSTSFVAAKPSLTHQARSTRHADRRCWFKASSDSI